MSKPPEIDATIPKLPPRAGDAHKGTFGRALVVGGSQGMAGAAALAGMAALRGGAGLVQVAAPESLLPVIASFEPSYMTSPLDEDMDGRISASSQKRIEELAAQATAVGLGPGLSRSDGLDSLVQGLYEGVAQPMVIDADGLNALAAHPARLSSAGGPRVFTPHPGEFARLLGGERAASREEACRQADGLALHIHGVVVLKGQGTYVTDGQRAAINETGNPGMATGGTGDVLTGLVTALLCQGLTPWEAARLGVHIHGLAGDLAAEELGQVSLVASDLLRFLAPAFRRSLAV